jgi:FkbM family methyltransferase
VRFGLCCGGVGWEREVVGRGEMVSMNVWGAQIRPPSLNRALVAWLLKVGLMARAERQFFEKTLGSEQIVVDVGANQGVFTLLFSRLVGPDGRAVALEPSPALFKALDGNCRINAADNVTRLPVAAGATRSQGVLNCSRFNGGDNRLSNSQKGPSAVVEIVPLDEILPNEQVDLIKIDVQGYELHVAKGMQAIVERSPAIKVLFEYWPVGLKHAGSASVELLEFFMTRHFSLFELSPGGFRRCDGHDILRSKKVGFWSWRNLLAVRE